MAADSRVCEGHWASSHTCFHSPADLVSWDWQSQGSRSWVTSALKLTAASGIQSLVSSSVPGSVPILCPFLPPSQVSSLQFSKSQCKPSSYQVFMEDACHSILAECNWKQLPLSSLWFGKLEVLRCSISDLPDTSGHPSQQESLCCVEFFVLPPAGVKHSQIHAKSSLGGMDWLI